MFDSQSRYASIEDATMTIIGPDGRERVIVYKRRRFVPPAGEDVTLVEHVVVQGDRLDNVTARYIGDPTQFWRVCDANQVLRPEELTEQVGRVMRIAMPSPGRG